MASSLRRCSSIAAASRCSCSSTCFSRLATLASFDVKSVEPPLDVVELAAELLFLRERALLDLLDLALAPARLRVESRRAP